MGRQPDLFELEATPPPSAPRPPWWAAPPDPWPAAARFRQGDRVETRWGRATVLRVFDTPHFESARSYLVKHDWSNAPPGFGHEFGEDECAPASATAISTCTDDEEATKDQETAVCQP